MAAERFRLTLLQWLTPGAVHTFVGAGGKTTALKRIAAILAASGVKARITTTTKVGIEEFAGYPRWVVAAPSELDRALADSAPVALLVGGADTAQGKYLGLDPSLIDGVSLRPGVVLLVEGDGARKLAVKAPRNHEPVIPRNSSSVFALMGASAFDGPVDDAHCYNHEKVLAILGSAAASLGPGQIAALAADREGCRKGVLPGMSFRLIINQGDLDQKRQTASEALRILHEGHGIGGALVSFQKEELYELTVE